MRDATPAALTVPQAAELLGVSPQLLYRLIREGTCPVPVIKLGAVYRIPAAAVTRLLEGVA